MDFEEIIENKRKNRGDYGTPSFHDDRRYHIDHGYRDEDEYSYERRHSNYSHRNHDNLLFYLTKIRNSKRLKILAIIAGIIILAVSVLLIVLLMPLMVKLYDYISQNGLQGILDAITGFLDKLWKGLGK